MLAALCGLISQRGEASPAHLDQGAGLETICFGVRLPPVSPHPSRPAESEYSHCSWSNSAPSIQQHVLSAPYLIDFFFAGFFFFYMHHQRRMIQHRHMGVEVFRQALKKMWYEGFVPNRRLRSTAVQLQLIPQKELSQSTSTFFGNCHEF